MEDRQAEAKTGKDKKLTFLITREFLLGNQEFLSTEDQR